MKPELVTRLFAEKRRRGMTMTELVNSIVENALKKLEPEILPDVHGGENDPWPNQLHVRDVGWVSWWRHPEPSRRSRQPDNTRGNVSDVIRPEIGERWARKINRNTSARCHVASGFSGPPAPLST
jgi:hypothetical protein